MNVVSSTEWTFSPLTRSFPSLEEFQGITPRLYDQFKLCDQYCKFENHQKILATVYGHPSFAPTEPGTN